MESLAISKFKATCLAVLEKVRRTGEPVLITRFGEPVAEVVPPSSQQRPESWLGMMRDRGTLHDDLIEPAVAPEEWNVLRP